MTATIPKKPRRPRGLRLSTMEALGFIDTPDVAITTSSIEGPLQPLVAPGSGTDGRKPQIPTTKDIFEEWRPEDIQATLRRGDFRWSLLVVIVLLGSALGTTAFWLWERPMRETVERRAEVAESAAALIPALDRMERAMTQLTLLEGTETDSSISKVPLEVDAAARVLFEASGRLPRSETFLRPVAADAATQALAASRTMAHVLAYRAAVLPILTAPSLETDPDLIPLDEAIRRFGEWQATFDRTTDALPEGILGVVTSGLNAMSADLPGYLSSYADALREDDPSAAESIVDELETRLRQLRAVLAEELEVVRAEIGRSLIRSRDAVRSLLG